MGFNGQPVTLTANGLWALIGWMAMNALHNTIDQDLADIKATVDKAN